MKKGIKKGLKRVLVFTLCIAMALQYYHISGANNEATITLTKNYDEKSNTVTIDAKASCLAGYEITGIQMTGQERKTGTSLQVTVSKNEDYVFTVFYRVKPVVQSQSVETPKTNVPEEGTNVLDTTPGTQDKTVSTSTSATDVTAPSKEITEKNTESVTKEGESIGESGVATDNKDMGATNAPESISGAEETAAKSSTTTNVQDKTTDVTVNNEQQVSTNTTDTMTTEPYTQVTPDESVSTQQEAEVEELSTSATITVTEIKEASSRSILASTSDDFLFNEVTQTVTGYNGSVTGQKDIIIPDTIKGLKVLHIGDNAFSGQQIKTLSFNCTSLQTIGKEAFYNNQITEVVLPDTVESIGVGAFESCSNLNTVKFPKSLKTIGDRAFISLPIANIEFNEGLETIGAEAFRYNGQVSKVVFPASLKMINTAAFDRSSISSITFLGDVDSIERSAFDRCGNLKEVIFHGVVKKLGSYAFASTWALTEITLPEGLTTMEAGAFASTGIKTFTFPSSVTVIPRDAVTGNTTSVIIKGTNITSIDPYAFNSDNITNISIKGMPLDSVAGAPWGANYATVEWSDATSAPSIVTVGPYLFNRATKTILSYNGTDINLHIPDTLTYNGVDYPVTTLGSRMLKSNTVVNITMDNGITGMANSCFDNVSTIESITLSSSISIIQFATLRNCKNLRKVVIPEGIEIIEGSAFAYCQLLDNITLPSTLTIIGSSAFSECSQLKNMTIPANVTRIDDYAFYQCNSLEKITILGNGNLEISANTFRAEGIKDITFPDRTKDSVTGSPWSAVNATINWLDESIPPAQFTVDEGYVYNRLTQTLVEYKKTEEKLIVPSKVTYNNEEYPVTILGDCLFQNRDNIKSVVIQEGITTIGEALFDNDKFLVNVELPDSLTTIKGTVFRNASSLTDITIPKGVTSIGAWTFQNTPLQSITIPSGITTIERGTFYNCTSLTDVDLPNTIVGVDRDAFNNCQALTKIEFPDSVTWYGGGVLSNCVLLEEVKLSRNSDYVGGTMFQNCTSLKHVDIPKGVQTIYGGAFQNCTNLESITIPEGVTVIDWGIVENCPNITSLTLPSSINDIHQDAFRNCPTLKTVRIESSRGSMDYTKKQPWNGPADLIVYYLGEYVNFDHKARINENGGFDIDINASIAKGGVYIDKIIFPDGKDVLVGAQNWPITGKYSYHVDNPGSYEFIGTDNKKIEYPYTFEVKEAAVTYINNTGQKGRNAGEVTKRVIAGDAITIPSEEDLSFQKEKAMFKSWNTKADGSGNIYTPNEVVFLENDITLYAIWQPVNDGEVLFRIRPGDENIGNISATSVTGNVGNELGANAPTTSIKQWNAKFDAWYVGDTKITDLSKEKIGNSPYYEARFIIDNNNDGKDDRNDKYTVNFEIAKADQGKAMLSTYSTEVGYNEVLGNRAASYTIDTETSPGVRFDGWYKNNGKVANLANERITENTTFEVRFTGDSSGYRVNFQIDVNDGALNQTEVYTTQVVSKTGGTVSVPTRTMKEDKKFLGWYKQGDATQTLLTDDEIANEPVDNITYIAKVANIYTVTYQIRQEDVALGSLDANKTSVKVQDGYTIGSEVPSITVGQGASFLGWYKDDVLVGDMANETITANTTYVAQFKLDRDGNGIDDRTQKYTYTCQIRETDKEKAKLDGVTSGEVVYGTKMKGLLPTVAIDTGISDGVNFLGWFKNDSKIDIETEVLTDNATYEARFDGAITKARVNFEVDATLASLDGDVSTLSKAYTLGQAIGKSNLPTVTVTNNKKKHVGWYKKGDSTQTLVDFDKETPDAKATYVAKILDFYTVTYTVRSGDEGLGSVSINSIEIVDGDTIKTVPETPTKMDKAKCIGWYKEDGTKVDLTKEKITKDTTYEARFILDRDDNNTDDREQKYTYTFKVRDVDVAKATLAGAKDGIVSGELLYGTNLKDKVPNVNIDLDITENVHFLGWYLNDKEITDFDAIKLTDNVVYEARFDGAITKARVYFEADASLATLDGDTKLVEKILPIKQAIGENALPTIHVLNSKKRHIGWYKKEDSKQTLVDFVTEMPTSNTTYVAKIVDIYTVNYLMRVEDVLIGTLSKQTDQVIAGDKIANLPETICSNDKGKFVGWYQDGKLVDLANEVITKDSIYVAHFMIDGDNDNIDDRTQDYTYTFQIRKEDAGKANLEGKTTDTVAYGTSLKDKVPNYSIDKEVSEGVTFLGWYKDDQEVIDINTEKVTGHVVYEARFSGKVTKTKVNFEVDDSIASIIGGNSKGEIIVNKDQAIGENKLPILDVKDEKKKHIGWYEKGDSSQTIIDFEKELPNPDIIYVPKIVDVYTVTFTVRKSDAKLGSIDKQSVEVIAGEKITDIPKIALANDKVTFIGWYHDGKKVNLEAENITKDTVYEARFQVIENETNGEIGKTEVKVNFEVDETLASLVDGSINFEKIVHNGQAIGEEVLPTIKLKDPKKRHIGWYKKGDSNQTLIDFSKEKPDPNVSYVAKIVDVFTVTYTVRSGDEKLGSISIHSSEVIDGNQIKVLPDITVANDQVEFLGWYYDGQKIALDKVRITKDSVFEARFQYNNGLGNDHTNETSHKKEKVETGDNRGSRPVFIVMLSSLLGILFSRKRRKVKE